MVYNARPEIGNWYRRLDRPQAFQVIAVDAQAGTVELEYFDGTVDEWPLAHWYALDIEPSAAPQDWSGAFDQVDRGELADGSDMRPEDWLEPLEGPRSAAARLELEAEARAVPPSRVVPFRARKQGAHKK